MFYVLFCCCHFNPSFLLECLDELSFESGELIMLKSRYGDNWFRGKLINGREGIFPKNFVEVVVSEQLGIILTDKPLLCATP